MVQGKIAVIFKTGHPEAEALAGRIETWLASRSLPSAVLPAGAAIPCETALAVVLGGDGTIIGVARKLVGTGAVLLGINFGAVGFLAPFEPFEWQGALEQALAGKLEIQTCLTLAWRLLRKGEEIACGSAINDVVVGRGSLARLVNLDLAINGEVACNLRSDGMILASPLGSPGYAASAGGPILHPQMQALELAPICPYGACLAPLVLPGNARVEAGIAPANGECFLTLDGQLGDALLPGDLVQLTGRPDSIRFLNDWKRFFTKLGNKARPGQRQAGTCLNTKQ